MALGICPSLVGIPDLYGGYHYPSELGKLLYSRASMNSHVYFLRMASSLSQLTEEFALVNPYLEEAVCCFECNVGCLREIFTS